LSQPTSNSFKSEATFNFGNASVVMIDASPIFTEVLTGILSGCGFRKLHRCSDLASATETLRAHVVDLVLIDPYAFGEAAYDFIQSLRLERRGPNASVPIIIVTAYTYVRLINAARRCGADYVISKPFSTRGLLERIVWVAESESRRSQQGAPLELVSDTGAKKQ
jgi:DNA-binding response OmpR family regulator